MAFLSVPSIIPLHSWIISQYRDKNHSLSNTHTSVTHPFRWYHQQAIYKYIVSVCRYIQQDTLNEYRYFLAPNIVIKMSFKIIPQSKSFFCLTCFPNNQQQQSSTVNHITFLIWQKSIQYRSTFNLATKLDDIINIPNDMILFLSVFSKLFQLGKLQIFKCSY